MERRLPTLRFVVESAGDRAPRMSRRAGRGRPCDLDAGGAYSIAWKAPARLKRVVVVSGAPTVATWAAKTLRLGPRAVVRSGLARGTVMLAPKDACASPTVPRARPRSCWPA